MWPGRVSPVTLLAMQVVRHIANLEEGLQPPADQVQSYAELAALPWVRLQMKRPGFLYLALAHRGRPQEFLLAVAEDTTYLIGHCTGGSDFDLVDYSWPKDGKGVRR